jgi:hypothetical protein
MVWEIMVMSNIMNFRDVDILSDAMVQMRGLYIHNCTTGAKSNRITVRLPPEPLNLCKPSMASKGDSTPASARVIPPQAIMAAVTLSRLRQCLDCFALKLQLIHVLFDLHRRSLMIWSDDSDGLRPTIVSRGLFLSTASIFSLRCTDGGSRGSLGCSRESISSRKISPGLTHGLCPTIETT